jgi:hypothetical protein
VDRREFLKFGGVAVGSAAGAFFIPIRFTDLDDDGSVELTMVGLLPGATVGIFRTSDMKELSLGHADDLGIYTDVIKIYTPTDVIVRVRHRHARPFETTAVFRPKEPVLFAKTITLGEFEEGHVYTRNYLDEWEDANG